MYINIRNVNLTVNLSFKDLVSVTLNSTMTLNIKSYLAYKLNLTINETDGNKESKTCVSVETL